MLLYLIGLCIVLLLWRWSNTEDPSEPPVLPGRIPILGHSLIVLGNSVDMFNAIVKNSPIIEKLGGVALAYFGPVKIYCVTDPEDCLTILNESHEKHYVYGYFKPFFGNGIFTADWLTWKKNRKLLNPAFSQQVLDGFIDIFNSRAENLVNQFAGELGKPFDHETYIRICTLETICATSFGIDSNEYKNLQENYLPLMEEMGQILNTRAKTFWFHIEFLYNLSSLKRRENQVKKDVNDFSNAIIKKKRAELKKSCISERDSRKLKPLIDLLMDLAEDDVGMTDEQIRSETTTLIIGGHETNAATLTFALTVLGSYPRVQEKAYQEILEVLGQSNNHVDKDNLSKLVYIEAVLRETLRLYPVAPIVLRQVNKDIKLRNCTLKAGGGCILSLYGCNRHPMWGPDAHEFRPERWLEKDTLPPIKYQHASFSLGRRSCIGKVYGIMAMKIVLAHVLRSYHISSDVSKMVVKMDIFASPQKGSHITLKRRQ